MGGPAFRRLYRLRTEESLRSGKCAAIRVHDGPRVRKLKHECILICPRFGISRSVRLGFGDFRGLRCGCFLRHLRCNRLWKIHRVGKIHRGEVCEGWSSFSRL